MTQKYILTGGPGSGKSSIILALERRGEYVIREAAEDVIKLSQSKGIERPWELPNFQIDILNLQIQRESRVPENAGRVFIDRGIPDGLAYVREETELYREIESQAPRYNGVFLIENLGETDQNKVRRENHEEAVRVEKELEKIYQNQGYEIQRVPVKKVKTRANLVLNLTNLLEWMVPR